MSDRRADAAALLEATDRFVTRMRRARKTKETIGAERRLELELQRAFRAQGFRVVEQMGDLRSKFAEAVSPRDYEARIELALLSTRQRFVDAIGAGHREGFGAGLRAVLGQIGLDISFTLEHPRAVAWLEGRAAARVTQIEETTRRYLRTLLTQAGEEGWSYDRTARAITVRYSEFGLGMPQAHIDSRAHLIALTEIGQAYVSAQTQVGLRLSGAGIPMIKRWITAEDERVDEEICVPNEAAGFIGFNADFPSGHSEPLGHPGCRCDIDIEVDVRGFI